MSKRWLCGVLLVGWLLPVLAHQVKGLYTASVPVVDDGQQAWGRAVQAGLGQVLVKVSGNGNAASSDALAEVDAKNWVERFEYQQPSEEGGQQQLQITFDKAAVDRLLRQAGLAQWGRQRPAVLVWLVVTPAGQAPRLVGSDSPQAKTLLAAAAQRGMPLFLPLLDLQETAQVAPSQVNVATLPLLAQLAQRYAAESILVGRIQESGGKWFGNWIWKDAKNQLQWSSEQQAQAALLSAAVTHVADDMAAHYAVLKDQALDGAVTVEVTGVASIKDYAAVVRYLQKLVGVSQVDVVKVLQDRVMVNVLMQGGVSGLAQALSSSRHLKVDLLAAADAARVDMVYRWYSR